MSAGDVSALTIFGQLVVGSYTTDFENLLVIGALSPTTTSRWLTMVETPLKNIGYVQNLMSSFVTVVV